MKGRYIIFGILVLIVVVAGCTYFYNSQDEDLKLMLYSNPNEEIPKNLEVTEEIVDSILIYKDTGELTIEHYTMKDALEVASLQPHYFTCKNNNKEPTLIKYYDDSSDCSSEEETGCGSSRWALICDDKFFVIESIHAARPTAYGPFYTPQKDLSQVEILYGYNVDNQYSTPKNFQIIAHTPFSDIDEETAKILAEKALEVKNTNLTVTTAAKEIRNGKEEWIVLFECNEQISLSFECGGIVTIDGYNVFVEGYG